MSGGDAPMLILDAAGMKVAIIASLWHDTVMEALVAGAVAACDRAGATHEVIRVPGAFELPLGCQRVARLRKVDALVALGVVIRGGTPHFEYVCQAATAGLLRVGLDESIPIGFGLLTVETEQQALDRAGLAGSSEDKGAEAAQAAISMALAQRVSESPVGFR
jgi:6,7-dimethyl-8-ribityllumazine synthase